MRYTLANADIQQGDLLTTTGVDGVFPPGLPVARVKDVGERAESSFNRISCAPLARVHGAMHVLVLTPGGPELAALAYLAQTRRTGPVFRRGSTAMIMRPGQQLLLPANPVFIWFTLLGALLLNTLLSSGVWGRAAWAPDMLALTLVFWGVHQPLRIGVGVAFFFGLAMDVQQGALARATCAGLYGARLPGGVDAPPSAVVRRAHPGGASLAPAVGLPPACS